MTTPLPIAHDTFYRTHHRDAPFGPEHASSSPITATSAPLRSGYSAFRSPHELRRYMIEFGWVGDLRVSWDDRIVYQFSGAEIGRGADDEPLVMPHSSVPDEVLTWDGFQHRLACTPVPDSAPEFRLRPVMMPPGLLFDGGRLPESHRCR